MKIYDITASICENLPSYDNKKPVIDDLMQIKKGDACNLSVLKISSHAGTHADMPKHFIDDGLCNATMPLEHFFGRAKVIRLSVESHVRKEDLEPHDIKEGDIILLDTGQSKFMRQGGLKEDFIALAPCAAEYLAKMKIKTVGVDYLSIDPYNAPGFPAHKILLGNGIAALEGLVLEDVPEGEYTLSALPLKIPGGNGSPVRAVLIDDGGDIR
jgi:arylformamidase